MGEGEGVGVGGHIEGGDMIYCSSRQQQLRSDHAPLIN